jgi:hypothetical protein
MERIYKADLAIQIGISADTLSRICNKELFEGLKKTGYKRYQKHFTQKQVNFLKENAVY